VFQVCLFLMVVLGQATKEANDELRSLREPWNTPHPSAGYLRVEALVSEEWNRGSTSTAASTGVVRHIMYWSRTESLLRVEQEQPAGFSPVASRAVSGNEMITVIATARRDSIAVDRIAEPGSLASPLAWVFFWPLALDRYESLGWRIDRMLTTERLLQMRAPPDDGRVMSCTGHPWHEVDDWQAAVTGKQGDSEWSLLIRRQPGGSRLAIPRLIKEQESFGAAGRLEVLTITANVTDWRMVPEVIEDDAAWRALKALQAHREKAEGHNEAAVNEPIERMRDLEWVSGSTEELMLARKLPSVLFLWDFDCELGLEQLRGSVEFLNAVHGRDAFVATVYSGSFGARTGVEVRQRLTALGLKVAGMLDRSGGLQHPIRTWLGIKGMPSLVIMRPGQAAMTWGPGDALFVSTGNAGPIESFLRQELRIR